MAHNISKIKFGFSKNPSRFLFGHRFRNFAYDNKTSYLSVSEDEEEP